MSRSSDQPEPREDLRARILGFGERSWRYSMLVRDGVIEKMFIEPEEPGDPFHVSDADTMLKYLDPEAQRPYDVAVFSRPGCVFCARAKGLLNDAGIPPLEVLRIATSNGAAALGLGLGSASAAAFPIGLAPLTALVLSLAFVVLANLLASRRPGIASTNPAIVPKNHAIGSTGPGIGATERGIGATGRGIGATEPGIGATKRIRSAAPWNRLRSSPSSLCSNTSGETWLSCLRTN